jgi:hypothetical protein
MKKLTVLLLLVSVALLALVGRALFFSPDPEQKTEVKYLVPDLSKISPDIIQALINGDEQEQIIRRGFVIQDYLAVTRKNILNVYRALAAANIPFAAQAELDRFSMAGKAQEIRLMRKCIKENGAVKETYQISIKGRGGLSSVSIATPETLDVDQNQKLREIFTAFYPEVNDRVYKLYFEIPLMGKENTLVQDRAGHSRTVEIDLFLKNTDGKPRLLFADGEVKFSEKGRRAVAAASTFRTNEALRPAYFGLDVTEKQGFKARNIALAGLPQDVVGYLADQAPSNNQIAQQIANQFKGWATPEVAELIFAPAPEHLGVYLNKKVLLNAEAFGFGPSAAIGEIFPYLRHRIAHLSYIGTGHTLDLQKELPYEQVFDYGAETAEARKEKFVSIAKGYDIFMTASDFEAARWAKELGMELIIYDPLTWFWREIPEVIGKADFYVAQNFFGVAERLQEESDLFPDHALVPAIISGIHDLTIDDDHENLLVNMGGLSNPYTNPSDLTAFAKVVFGFSNSVLESAFEKTTYVSSRSIVEAVKAICPAQTLQPQQVQSHLSSAKLAIMTSGLGNIYEASSMRKRVIWLPPANDSQGQQVTLLKRHGMADYAIDWADIFIEDRPIDYFAPQEPVMRQIAVYMKRLAREPRAKARFINLLCDHYERAQKGLPPALAKLADTFETDGAKQAAESIIEHLKKQ